jgi:hypothetical protein
VWLDPLSEPPEDELPMVVLLDDTSTDEPPAGDQDEPALPVPR